MLRFALSPVRQFLLAGATVTVLALASLAATAQPDPPAQAGRISYISGNVSVQPAGANDWGQAEPNSPLGPGDRVFTDDGSRAEIQVGQTFVRIGPNSDVSLVDSTAEGIYFGVAQGSVHLHSTGLWDGQAVYVNTPSGASVLRQNSGGELRVDVLPEQSAAIFTNYGSFELITGAGGFQQPLLAGYALELVGSNPVTPQWLEPSGWDRLDAFSHERDQQIANAMSYRFVSREIPGAYELDAAGDWQPGTPYGAVWFPRNVEYGWSPYHNGHWVNRAPWGWVWVENESWGYAPFHYGRWVSVGGRWGWVPGPPAEHPVWSPALVVFAGGINLGGAVVSAWFPLGPGEPYHPWYRCSPEYVNRVNITNITVTNVVHVQTTYVNVTNVTYVNRSIGVTAMRHEDFAAGRPVAQAAVRIDVHQMDHVQPLAAPVPRPTPQALVGPPPARAVPIAAARPVLINAKGMAVAAAPNARPVAPPVKAAPRAIVPLPGHVAAAPPANLAKPEARPLPIAAPVAGKPAPPTANPVPKATPEPVTKTPLRATDKAPLTPNGKITAPEIVKPAPAANAPLKEPEARTPPHPGDKPAVEPTKKPPEAAAPGAKNDKNKDKKDDKDKNKDKDKN